MNGTLLSTLRVRAWSSTFFRLAVGGTGQVVLARHLNEHRVPTFTGAARWRASMVGHLLINQRALGFMQQPQVSVEENGRRRVTDPQGPVEGCYPAVISEEVFKQAQLAMRRRRRHGGHKVIPARSNLMTRLGRCCSYSLFLRKRPMAFPTNDASTYRSASARTVFGFPYRKLEAVLSALDRLTELIQCRTDARSQRNGSLTPLSRGHRGCLRVERGQIERPARSC